MANNFVKIWTTILHDEKFLSLTLAQRSIYLQLIMEAKIQSDSGHVHFKSYSQASQVFGADDSTTTRALLTLNSKSLIELKKEERGVVSIFLPNYLYWQQVRPQEVIDSKRAKSLNGYSKSPLTRPDQTIPDQTNNISCGLSPQEVADLFNEICKTLPKVRVMQVDTNRYKTTKRQLTKHPSREFWELIFRTVQGSDFLSGRSGAWSGCGFDWILKPANLIKIYEGNYGKVVAVGKIVQATTPKEPEMTPEEQKQADIARRAAVAAFKGGTPTPKKTGE